MKIEEMTPQERIAGYVKTCSDLALLGAKLRTKYKDVRTDYYEGWTQEEEAEWDNLCGFIEPYFYALTEEEKQYLQDIGFENLMGQLTRGENPLEK